MAQDNICSICDFSLTHLFCECLLAIDLWLSASWDNLPANIVVLNLTTCHLYLNGQMMRRVLLNCDIMFVVVLDNIWCAKNKRIFPKS